MIAYHYLALQSVGTQCLQRGVIHKLAEASRQRVQRLRRSLCHVCQRTVWHCLGLCYVNQMVICCDVSRPDAKQVLNPPVSADRWMVTSFLPVSLASSATRELLPEQVPPCSSTVRLLSVAAASCSSCLRVSGVCASGASWLMQLPEGAIRSKCKMCGPEVVLLVLWCGPILGLHAVTASTRYYNM
jgi:hypothetical protein